MITLSLLKYLEINGFGTIDKDLFWEKLGLDLIGIEITSTGLARERGARHRQDYTLYSRGKTDVSGYEKLEQVRNFINKSYEVCELPSVPPVTEVGYHNVTLMPPSTITNSGEDANGRIIWSLTGTIYY